MSRFCWLPTRRSHYTTTPLASIAGADHVALRRVGEVPENLLLVASSDSGSFTFPPTLNIPTTTFLTRESIATGEPIRMNDYGAYPGAREDLEAAGVQSMYFVPIKSVWHQIPPIISTMVMMR